MPSFLIEQTFEAFNAIDSDVARACFAKMICEDKGEYITDTYVLNSIGSD